MFNDTFSLCHWRVHLGHVFGVLSAVWWDGYRRSIPCDILLQGEDGCTATIMAAAKGKGACLKLLVDAKVDLEGKVRRAGGKVLGKGGGGGGGGR